MPRPPKIPDDRRRDIIIMWNSGNFTQQDIAKHFGMNQGTINTIVNRSRQAGIKTLWVGSGGRQLRSS